jgi:hypothetical protein
MGTNGTTPRAFAGYSDRGELELHDGQRVACREPTFVEGGTLWELWRRTMVGPEQGEAYRELRAMFPVVLGLQEEFAATPMNDTEFMEIVTSFFHRPSRRPMGEAVAEGMDSVPASPAPPTSMM